MNEQIRISPVRLIGAEGEQHGIVPTTQALEMARDVGMDLVEIAAQERPPVCKIMDYGKHKYEQSKKQHQKTHQQKLKELRVRPKTGDHDIDTRVHQALKFLEHGDKVLLRVQFRGREMQHIEEGRRVMDQMLEGLLEHCKLEKSPSMEGKQMTALLAPKGTGTGGGGGGAAKPKPKPKPLTLPSAEAKPKPVAEAAPAVEAKPVPPPEVKPSGPAPSATG